MAVRDLIPWGRTRSSVPSTMRDDEFSPFLTLHREMNRLFDDVVRGFDAGLPSVFGQGTALRWPSLEVTETDKEVKVMAELPGLDEKDVEVLIEDGLLTIKGEKRAEAEDQGRRFSERFYGRFARQFPVGEFQEDKVQASFEHGVLTVTLPKSERAQAKAKRIPIGGGKANH